MKTLRPWRLAAQIWGLSLLTLGVVVVALSLLWMSRQVPSHHPRLHRHIMREIAAHGGDRTAMQAAVDRASAATHDVFTVFDASGRVAATTRGEALTPLAREQVIALQHGKRLDLRPVVAVPLTAADGFVGYGLVRLRLPPSPPFSGPSALALVLAVLAIASLLLAHRLLGPLRRLVAAAQAFGGGDVHARVGPQASGPLGVLGQVFDEMAARVAELLHSQRELLANVSHELRTPLARLKVALELAAESDGDTARTELRLAEDDLVQLERLVEDVLRVASLDLAALRTSGSQDALQRERLDMAALAGRTARRFSTTCPDRQVEVTVPDEPMVVDGDGDLLRRALDNLLDNARKYSEAGGRIGVEVAIESEQLVVTVSDDGVGIDAADLPYVFTPFFRADRSRARRTGGVGLGLTLVQRIAQAHGGSVTIASEPGRGTRISVRLPLAVHRPAE